jgi:hypothetical protein
VRRFTLITIVVLVLLLAIAAYFQIRGIRGPRRFPGPGVSVTPPPVITP